MSLGFGLGFPRSVSPAGGPTLNFQFAGSTTLDPLITFTRASTATFFNSAGVLTSAAVDAPRFDFNPSTLAAQGLLIEESRTNSIRNNTMVGAVAGTPGTLPTNWTGATTVDGLAREVVGTGTENGINYIDVRYSGTSGTAGNSTLITFDANNFIVAANAQTWTGSIYARLVSGSLTNVSLVALSVRYNDAAAALLTSQNTAFTPTSSFARITNAFTAANASTAFVNATLLANFTDSSAVDFTLRIGLPQLELGAFATSVIPTTTTALTRSADVASVNTLSPWYNAAEGTVYSDTELLSGVTSTNRFIFEFNDGVSTSGDKWDVRRTGGASCRAVVRDNGSAVGDRTINNSSNNLRIASALNSTALALCANGSAVNEITLTTPGNITVNKMQIGGGVDTNTLQLNGYIRRITYYPRRLSNAELISITS
jgi:hypothetical protein